MKKEELKNLTNDELDMLLDEGDWCDKDLLREHDERTHDGRIQLIPIDDLKKHFQKRREQRKKAS